MGFNYLPSNSQNIEGWERDLDIFNNYCHLPSHNNVNALLLLNILLYDIDSQKYYHRFYIYTNIFSNWQPEQNKIFCVIAREGRGHLTVNYTGT